MRKKHTDECPPIRIGCGEYGKEYVATDIDSWWRIVFWFTQIAFAFVYGCWVGANW